MTNSSISRYYNESSVKLTDLTQYILINLNPFNDCYCGPNDVLWSNEELSTLFYHTNFTFTAKPFKA